jgi:hypothetical protein
LVLIHTSRDVTATLDNVWNVISDMDREPEFWHGTKSIKNSKTGNTIEREVVIAFRNSKCRETVKLVDKKSVNIDNTRTNQRKENYCPPELIAYAIKTSMNDL